jgi:hypothetical protein
MNIRPGFPMVPGGTMAPVAYGPMGPMMPIGMPQGAAPLMYLPPHMAAAAYGGPRPPMFYPGYLPSNYGGSEYGFDNTPQDPEVARLRAQFLEMERQKEWQRQNERMSTMSMGATGASMASASSAEHSNGPKSGGSKLSFASKPGMYRAY